MYPEGTELIVRLPTGDKFYVMYTKDGTAFTYVDRSLPGRPDAEYGVHILDHSGLPCVFLGGKPCKAWGRSGVVLSTDNEIFDSIFTRIKNYEEASR